MGWWYKDNPLNKAFKTKQKLNICAYKFNDPKTINLPGQGKRREGTLVQINPRAEAFKTKQRINCSNKKLVHKDKATGRNGMVVQR